MPVTPSPVPRLLQPRSANLAAHGSRQISPVVRNAEGRQAAVNPSAIEHDRMSRDEIQKDAQQRDGDGSRAEPNRLPRILSGGRSLTLVCIAVAAVAVAGVAVWMLLTRPATPGSESAHSPGELVAPPDRISGSKWMDEYAELDADDEPARHRFVLEQAASGNLPETWDDWVTVRVTGKKGTVVEFEASPHGLRIGSTSDWVEIPLDGPDFAAAAEILGRQVATAWMVEQIHLQAENNGGAIHFFAAAEIARSLGYDDWEPNAPDGRKMKAAAFFRQRSALLRDWLKEHEISADTLVSGYFKSVVPPIDGLTRSEGLEMVGGYTDAGDRVQGLSGGFHHRSFFDYSHNIRLVKNAVRVNGRTMTVPQFFRSVSFALEFGFRATSVPVRAYPYPAALAEWMARNKYLRYPLDG
jgi:hypothetical protein